MKLSHAAAIAAFGVFGTLAAHDENDNAYRRDASDRITESNVRTRESIFAAVRIAVTPNIFPDELRKSYTECLDAAGGETWAMQDCIGDEWDYQDARLNTAYQELKKLLPEPQWFHLRNEQRKWFSDLWSDEECEWDAETEGQAQRISANDCTLRKLAQRASEFERMLNDLKSNKS